MNENLNTSQTQPVKTVEQSRQSVKSNNFLVMLLSVLLLGAVLIAGFFAFQTQKLVAELNAISALTMVPTTEPVPTDDPTVDWETYTNTKYGFSFKYPKDWVQDASITTGVKQASFDTDTFNFFVAVHDNVADLTKWFDHNQAGKAVGMQKIGDYNFSVVEGGLMVTSREFAFIKNNNLLRFVIEPAENVEVADAVFVQILSTFKFTN